jgi:hypothetical protein
MSLAWRGRRGAGLALLAMVCLAPGLLAQARAIPLPARPAASAPSPGSELTISLMTMGVGGEVWERFGHNAIVVEDRLLGTSTAYNYGMFSFRQENFLLRFLQGRMNYWMAGYPTEDDVPRYIAAERSVWQQELNLNPAQRLALKRLLQINALPEHAYYRYDYYRDNCSTRVRDALDQVLGGALRRQLTAPASGSYRFHTQRLNTNNLALYTGLLLVLGHGADAPVTQWEEMFLPLKLREYLRQVRVPDSTGTLVPLVKSERAVYESRRYPVPDAPPSWGPGYLVAGLVLGGLFIWGGAAGRRIPAARRTLLVVGTLWMALGGLAGAILAGLWGLTDHVIAARNENVLQISLFSLVLAGALPLGLRDGAGSAKAATLLAVMVGGLSLLGLLLKALPMFDQVNGQVLALFVPANVGLMLGVMAWFRGREE